MELWVGSNVKRLFFFLYIAACHTTHVHFFFSSSVYIVSCHICILSSTFDIFIV